MRVLPICPDCQTAAVLKTGAEVYRRRPDLKSKRMWVCSGCGARVGCHPGTDEPLGTLAGSHLRQLRRQVHDAFDPLWRRPVRSSVHLGNRAQAYCWLSRSMALSSSQCHIGSFDEGQCTKALSLIDDLVRGRRMAP